MTGPDRQGARRTVGLLAGGTAVLGLSGLLILTVTARRLGAVDYAVFGVFWSAMFFVVAVLFGLQQESTRAVASHRLTGRDGETSLVRVALIVSTLAALAIAGTSPWWGRLTFGDGGRGLALIVALGAAGYVATGVLAGICAGSDQWGAYAAMLAVEGTARAAGIVGVLLVSGGVGSLAWMVVAAYPVTLLLIGIPLRARVRPHLHVDEPMGVLLGKAGKALAAAVSVAAMVNGFPLLMSVFDRGASASLLGTMTLAVVLTRAPLLVPLLAMQSYLITVFAQPQRSPLALLLPLVGGCVAFAAALAAVAAGIGPVVMREFFGPDFDLSGLSLALLVLSSGVLGALCASSSALIARNLHSANAVGWALAIGVSIAVLAWSSATLDIRAPVALLAGPTAGLLWNLGAAISLVGVQTAGADATRTNSL